MVEKRNPGTKKNKLIRNIILYAIILGLIAGLPFMLLTYQAKHSGMSRSQVLGRIFRSGGARREVPNMPGKAGVKTDFLDPKPIGFGFTDPPLISHVQAKDLDGDGLLDVIVCDCRSNSVNWIRQNPAGTFTESVLAGDMIAPAHVEIIDFENDGDNDIMVAVLGMLFPNNDKIGSVVILENNGKNEFTKRVIAEKIARVSDVRAGDLDADGDKDLAVAQFGYDDGETRWIENLGGWKFRSHILQNLSGPINVIISDIDGDRDSDIISLVSQEWEEIYLYINEGNGNFRPRLLWGSSNQDFGSSGIFLSDADQDGDEDILYTNGDAFDYIPPQGRPWHGVHWLENKGNLVFEAHRLCNFMGAYNARAVDIDKDGDLDIFSVSAFNIWSKPESQSFIWLENTGNMQFITHDIANNPTHLLTLELGDFNNDGLTDMVTGGMHTYPPNDRMARITLWINNGKLSGTK
jgi:hypothetical protein